MGPSKFTLLAASLAALASAQSLVTFDCAAAHSACLDDVAAGKTATIICTDALSACQDCAAKEHDCRVPADYSGQINCTASAQVCYELAESPGSTLGAYGCQQAFETCSNAPDANHSLCASQRSGCDACSEEELKCRNAPGANQSLCSSGAGGCFDRAMTFGGDIGA